MNEDRTCANAGAELTQARSPDVPAFALPDLPFDIQAARSFIYREREAVGANTTKGRHISKFGEQMENFVKAESLEQAELLKALLIETEGELRRMNRVRIAAPTLAIAN